MRKATSSLKSGFTIVELLIIIVVIAILAAIIIVGYNGVTKNAVETSMKSDLQSAASQLAIDYRNSGAYPATAGAVNNGTGLLSSSGNTFTYAQKSYGYCVTVANPKTNVTYRLKSSALGKVEEGICDVIVSTLAGSGTGGFANGTGTAAQFYYPMGVAVDASGVLHIADQVNHRIRKVTAAGVVTTFAGSGTSGNTDGTGTAAQFNQPMGIALEQSGIVYVAESSANRIRKITPAGVVTVFAGSTSGGYVDATGTAARFYSPRDVAVDNSGVVYVADYTNHRIRKITPAGVVTTFAGSGTAGYLDGNGTAARFNYPSSITVDNAGNVYVGDSSNYRIRKISPAGDVTTLAGSGVGGYADGQGTAAQFYGAMGLAVDGTGTLYVADTTNNRIRSVSPTGAVTTIAGSGTAGHIDGAAATSRFNAPSRIAVDSSGTLYVTDRDGNRVRKITQ